MRRMDPALFLFHGKRHPASLGAPEVESLSQPPAHCPQGCCCNAKSGAGRSAVHCTATLDGTERATLTFRHTGAVCRHLGTAHEKVRKNEILDVLGARSLPKKPQRRWHEGELNVEEGDRLYRIARIVHRAIEVFGSEAGARHWLKRPQVLFKGAAPLALLRSDAGAKAVENQLGRIEHGIFA